MLEGAMEIGKGYGLIKNHRLAMLLLMFVLALTSKGVFPQGSPSIFNSDSIERINIDIRNDKYGKISSLMVFQGKRIVYERYYGFTQIATLHPISSVTKSITSLAVGVCIDKGYIPSLDVRVMDYFPDFQHVFDRDTLKQYITLRHLLSQTSGLKWDEWSIHYSYAGNPLIELSQNAGSWFEQILKLPMESPPGAMFAYNSGLSEIIKEIICRATGNNFVDFVNQNILTPIGINNFYWDTYPGNGEPAWGGLNLTTRDMARIGNLVLDQGMWANQRVVSEIWLAQSFSLTTETPRLASGLHWWVDSLPNGQPIYFSAGYGDQYVYIIPHLGLVMAMNGKNFTDHKWDKRPEDIIFRVVAALTGE